jgi:hypothetical protein
LRGIVKRVVQRFDGGRVLGGALTLRASPRRRGCSECDAVCSHGGGIGVERGSEQAVQQHSCWWQFPSIIPLLQHCMPPYSIACCCGSR